MKKNFFCSWSGGKDSALALYKAIQAEYKPKKLLNMLSEEGKKSRSHNLSLPVLEAQAEALNISLETRRTSWDNYEETFIGALKDLHKEGIGTGVFGDIDLEGHREWEEKVCKAANMEAYLPLWQIKREELLNEFIEEGFKTMIIVVNEEYLDEKYLGKIIDKELIKEFNEIGIDPSGENGEYHTVVLDGPIFNKKLEVNKLDHLYNDGYWFQEFELINF
ncbi:MAG: diphthine--ammonia ligase [Halanaerobiales bacterium]|nr:diphthine--ammonia ligase [Halanaerobiales bacterium]